MQVILKEDVVNLGYKDDIVTVKDGCQVTSTLYSLSHTTLELQGSTSDTTRKDLTLLVQEFLQEMAATQSEIRYLTPPSVDVKKKKYCRFKKNGIKYIDYKDPEFLKKFLNEQGKILPRRITGTSL